MSTRFTALTVRQGDAFLLEDNGLKCLFDSGVDESIIDLLKFKGIDSLDLAICSHNDSDHVNGFIELFDANFPIKEIWLPGLWASVLKFVADNCKKRGEVVLDNEVFNGELDSLFSDEPVDDDSFERDLTFLGEKRDSEVLQESCDRLHDKLASYMIENPDTIKNLFELYLRDYCNRESDEECLGDKDDVFLDDDPWDWYPSAVIRLYKLYRYCRREKEYFHKKVLEKRERIQYSIKQALNFNLKKIINLATKAKEKGCHIRWFEPSLSCTKEAIDYGFISLNSSKMCQIRVPKSGMAYMYSLSLSKVNRYSLVFEYIKNDVPVIRFSADSKITCQSVSPYPENIIVTAPHHGSAANAKVYSSLQGNDIIWVRSDMLRSDRPCSEFKSRKNKYCLVCEKYNFISEVCFEYIPVLKKWDCVRGEQCRCK